MFTTANSILFRANVEKSQNCQFTIMNRLKHPYRSDYILILSHYRSVSLLVSLNETYCAHIQVCKMSSLIISVSLVRLCPKHLLVQEMSASALTLPGFVSGWTRLAAWCELWNGGSSWCHVTSWWCSSIGRTADETFKELQEQSFLWRREASFTKHFGLFNFAELLQKQKTIKENLCSVDVKTEKMFSLSSLNDCRKHGGLRREDLLLM